MPSSLEGKVIGHLIALGDMSQHASPCHQPQLKPNVSRQPSIRDLPRTRSLIAERKKSALSFLLCLFSSTVTLTQYSIHQPFHIYSIFYPQSAIPGSQLLNQTWINRNDIAATILSTAIGHKPDVFALRFSFLSLDDQMS